MHRLELQVRKSSITGKALGHSAVQEQIASLPAFDVSARIAGFQRLLSAIAHSPFAGKQRAEILQIVATEIDNLLPAYQEKILQNSFPLPVADDTLYNNLQALLQQAAEAYKLLIIGLLDAPAKEGHEELLQAAILQCIRYIGQQTLQAYAVYRTPPDDLWRDLHRLYVYAEKRAIHRGGDASDAPCTIQCAYARILLLVTANPHHLMHGEIYQAYAQLEKFAPVVKLLRTTGLSAGAPAPSLDERFFFDIAGAGPPVFGMQGFPHPPTDPRLLDMGEVLTLIGNRMKQLVLNHSRSLQLRLEWELLLRLRTAWEKRAQRSLHRKDESGISVKAIVGLSSCHFFYSAYVPFEPEQSEIEHHGVEFKDTTSLSLVPSDETPWLDSDLKSKLQSGVLKPRAYSFDVENTENDVWKKAISSGQRMDTELEKNLEQRSLGKIFTFSQVNTSSGGAGLKTPPDSIVRLRVGELVAAFPHDEDEGGEPALNMVRWIRSSASRTLSIGLRRIDGEVSPVAVRSLEEQARFQHYARGFIITRAQEKTSIILPAGLFAYGNRVLINHGEHLETVQLKSLQHSTRVFSQFTFTPVPANAADDGRIIRSLKALLRDDPG